MVWPYPTQPTVTKRGIIDLLVSKRPENSKQENLKKWVFLGVYWVFLGVFVGVFWGVFEGPIFTGTGPKGAKDEDKRPEGPPARSRGPDF